MKVMLMANSIPDTSQETTRGPQEELQQQQQQEAIPGSPAGHRESGTGRMPTLLHLPCSTFHRQPGRKNPGVILLNSSRHQPRHRCQPDYINHLLKAGVWWLFSPSLRPSLHVYCNSSCQKQIQHPTTNPPGVMDRLPLKVIWKVQENELKLERNKEKILKLTSGSNFKSV